MTSGEIDRAYRMIAGRSPSPSEAAAARSLVDNVGELAFYQHLSASTARRDPLSRSLTLPVNDRPWYLRECLSALRASFERCRTLRPPETAEYELVVCAEPCLESVRECLAIDFIPARLIVNRTRQGVRRNPFQALDYVFRVGSAFNLHLEDDVVLTADAFDLVGWYYDTFRHQPLAYLSYSLFADSADNTKGTDEIRELPCFEGLGWCTFRESWVAHFRPNWFRDDDLSNTGWDWQMRFVSRARGLRTLQPALSRSTHIGRNGGTCCTPELHDLRFGALKLCEANGKSRGFRIVG